MKKTPIKDILHFAYNEGDIYNTEAPFKALRVAINLRLLVADKIDSKGVAVRFKLTPFGYDLSNKLTIEQKIAYEASLSAESSK